MTTTSEPTVARASRPRSPVRTAVLVLVLAGCASPVRKDPETGAPLDTADSARIADSATDTSAPADTHDRATDSGSASGSDSGLTLPGMVHVRSGTFSMGCRGGADTCMGTNSAHEVTLTRDYAIGETEVTQEEFWRSRGYEPSDFWCPDGGSCPVVSVTWDEAVAFANARSREDGLEECYACTGEGAEVQCAASVSPYDCEGYRLPTEAEWEAAARCGTELLYAGSDTLDEVAWTLTTSGGGIKPVGLLVPNACATYDMSGNVAEWVHDFWHGLSDYDTEDGVDPEGQPTGDGHVHRGGMWAATGIYCRNSYRRGAADWEAEDWRGFRLARTLVGDG